MCFKHHTAFRCGHITSKEGFCDEVASSPLLHDTVPCLRLDTKVEPVHRLCGVAGYYCKYLADGARLEHIYQDIEHHEGLGQYYNTRLADLEEIYQNIVAPHHQLVALKKPLTQAVDHAHQEAVKDVVAHHTKAYHDKQTNDWVIGQLKQKASLGEHHFKLAVPNALANQQELPRLVFPPDEPRPRLTPSPLARIPLLANATTSDESLESLVSEQQHTIHSNIDSQIPISHPSTSQDASIDLDLDYNIAATNEQQAGSIIEEDKNNHAHVREEEGSMLSGRNDMNEERVHGASVQREAIVVQGLTASPDTATSMPPPPIPPASTIPQADRTFPIALLTATPAIAQLPVDPATGDRSTGVQDLLRAELAGIHQIAYNTLKRNASEEVKAKRKMTRTPKNPKSSARTVTTGEDGDIIITTGKVKKAAMVSDSASRRPKRKLQPVNYTVGAPGFAAFIGDDDMSFGSVQEPHDGQVFAAAPSLVVKLKASATTISPSYAPSNNDTVHYSDSSSNFDNTATHDLGMASQFAHAQVTNPYTPSPCRPYATAGTPQSLNRYNGSSCQPSLNTGCPSMCPMFAQQAYYQDFNHTGHPGLPYSPYSDAQSPTEQLLYTHTPGHGTPNHAYQNVSHGASSNVIKQADQSTMTPAAACIPRTNLIYIARPGMPNQTYAGPGIQAPVLASPFHYQVPISPAESPANALNCAPSPHAAVDLQDIHGQPDPSLNLPQIQHAQIIPSGPIRTPNNVTGMFEHSDRHNGQKSSALEGFLTDSERRCAANAESNYATDAFLYHGNGCMEQDLTTNAELAQSDAPHPATGIEPYQPMDFFDGNVADEDFI